MTFVKKNDHTEEQEALSGCATGNSCWDFRIGGRGRKVGDTCSTFSSGSWEAINRREWEAVLLRIETKDIQRQSEDVPKKTLLRVIKIKVRSLHLTIHFGFI